MTNVTLQTNFGTIRIQLDTETTPKTAENFLNYVKEGFYDSTIFHRVINNFMIQGGGFTAEMQQKSTQSPIENEADVAKLKNVRGTVSMARTQDPHSASAQFFINVVDNNFLNHTEKSLKGWGYCPFGEVIEGMDVVDKIRRVPTTSQNGHQDVPRDEVIIQKASVEE
jgi:peptidyl-prolyl cis-trans isomerase B (cyclophilin B)